MRAMFMQEKYGKVDTGKVIDKPQITENQKPSGLVNSNVSPVPRSPITSIIKQPVDPSPSTSKQSTVPLPDKPEILVCLKLNITSRENCIEKLDSKRVLWQIPPEVWIDPSWSVSVGDNSKELEVQTQRNRRENETFYASLNDIPLNPKDPWDVEMDFDDSLTPEIPIDQPPDADTMEADSVGAAPPNIGVPVEDKQVGSTSSAAPAVAAGANGAASEPDLELLAVLLKNPQLVFALTSNHVGTLPSEQTVALLDMLKQTGLGLSELVNSLANGAGVPKVPEHGPETIPASLPSPTPPKDLTARASWRSEFPTQVKASDLQQAHLSNKRNTAPIASTVQQSFSNVVSSLPSQSYASVSALPAQIQTNVPSIPQLVVSVNPPTQHVAHMNNLLNRAPVHQHAQSYSLAIHQQPAVNKPAHELQNIPNPALAHSLMPEPNASCASLPWQSSAANVTTSGRNTTPDPWAVRSTTNSFNVASPNSVPFPNQNVYGNQSTQSTYNAYGSTPISSHSVLPGQGLDRNGYTRTVEHQTVGRDAHQPHSRSPGLGVGRVYGGKQGYIPESSRQWNYGQQSYSPAEPSRLWSSGQKSCNPAEPSRQWTAGQQSYNPSEPSRQWSSGQQSYTPAQPSRPWNSGHQGQKPETLRQRGLGQQQDYYNPSDGRSSYDQQWRRR